MRTHKKITNKSLTQFLNKKMLSFSLKEKNSMFTVTYKDTHALLMPEFSKILHISSPSIYKTFGKILPAVAADYGSYSIMKFEKIACFCTTLKKCSPFSLLHKPSGQMSAQRCEARWFKPHEKQTFFFLFLSNKISLYLFF